MFSFVKEKQKKQDLERVSPLIKEKPGRKQGPSTLLSEKRSKDVVSPTPLSLPSTH